MRHLSEQLQRLQAAWIAKGMPNIDWLAPGLDPAEIERVLSERGFATPAEVVEWFAWHNGIVEGSGQVQQCLGPSVFEPLALEASFSEAMNAAEVARQVEAEGLVLESDDGRLWEDSWLPLARDAGGALLAVDTASTNEGQVPVRTVDFWNVDLKTVRAQSLAEVVEFWIDVLDSYCVWSPAERNWECDFAALPVDARLRDLL